MAQLSFLEVLSKQIVMRIARVILLNYYEIDAQLAFHIYGTCEPATVLTICFCSHKLDLFSGIVSLLCLAPTQTLERKLWFRRKIARELSLAWFHKVA